jgi:hypothetical protein
MASPSPLTEDSVPGEVVDNDWEPAIKAKSSIWQHFMKSKVKNSKTRRFRAKCVYCTKTMDGKPQSMTLHITTICKSIPGNIRGEAMAVMGNQTADSTAIDHDARSIRTTEAAESTVTNTTRQLSESRSLQSRVSQFTEYAPITDLLKERAALALLRALISCKIPLSIVEDYHFQVFLEVLRPGYVPPSRGVITNNHLIKLYVEALSSRCERLKLDTVFTMLWDGWTDCSGTSIYGLSLLFDYDKSEIVDIVKMSDVRHTATNQMLEIESRFEQTQIPIGNVKVIVTDSPSVMLKLRRDMCTKYKHMIGLPCALHVLNTLCKDICKDRFASSNIKSMCRIVNFFTGSHIWLEHSKVSCCLFDCCFSAMTPMSSHMFLFVVSCLFYCLIVVYDPYSPLLLLFRASSLWFTNTRMGCLVIPLTVTHPAIIHGHKGM